MPTSPFDLTGKVAVVTSGNGGIGLSMARGLAAAGAAIAIVGRRHRGVSFLQRIGRRDRHGHSRRWRLFDHGLIEDHFLPKCCPRATYAETLPQLTTLARIIDPSSRNAPPVCVWGIYAATVAIQKQLPNDNRSMFLNIYFRI
jgi:hypothetical protein